MLHGYDIKITDDDLNDSDKEDKPNNDWTEEAFSFINEVIFGIEREVFKKGLENSEIMSKCQLQNSNNIEISQNFNNSIASKANGQEFTNSLNNNEIMQLNNNLNNNQSKNNSNQSSLLMNNIGTHSYYNQKSWGNISNSGNVNTTSSFK